MRSVLLIAVALVLLAAVPRPSSVRGVRIASKKFTESVILSELAVQLIRNGGDEATHVAELGGTRLVFDALERGEIDAYPEYTGTLREEIFAGREASSPEKLRELLRNQGVVMSESLGFSNNYALAVTRPTAERLNLTKISDLTRHPDLRLGLSHEFVDRGDGWKNLRKHYQLPQANVSGMDHDLAYRYLEAGTIDVTDVYTTDARLAELGLVLLVDDRQYFPRYDAVLLWRTDLATRHPEAVKQLGELQAKISEEAMIALNAEVEADDVSEAQAAAKFLREKLKIDASVEDESVAHQVWQRTLEHLDLVRRSLISAIFAALPLGVAAAKWPRLGRVILGVTGIVQTVPALALLVLLIAPVAYLGLDTLGAGSTTAIVALFLYSLLPIVQNTATGLSAIPAEYHESAAVLAVSPTFRLLHIELPLALPSILAGIKTAAVLNVGFATLGALVGARGYGQPILTGIRLNDMGMILQGAVPAACLAILLQAAFEVMERSLLPEGLRSDASRSNHDRAR